MKNNISVFGPTGFIGTNFCKIYEDEIVQMPKTARSPQTNNVLYLISTVDNYNVFSNPYVDIDTNLKILIETLEKCKEQKDLVFNFVSSWFVYGKTESLPASETNNCNPKGFYSITKRAAEQLLISYCDTFKIKYRIFRLSNVYGMGDNKVSIKRNALQYLINEVVNNRDINLYNNGENIRDFIHVDDVCRALHFCMKNAGVNEIINIGSGIPYKFRDIMCQVREKVGSKSNFKSIEPPEFHKIVQVEDMWLDITKLKSLGFQPNCRFSEELDILIERLEENKNEKK